MLYQQPFLAPEFKQKSNISLLNRVSLVKSLFFCNFLVILFFLTSIPCYGNSQEKILFLHIPKTAGTTFRSILFDHYPVEEIYGCNQALGSLDFLSASCLAGHFFYFHIKDLCKDRKKITFFRDPIKRVLSEQRYYERVLKTNPQREISYRKTHGLPIKGNPIDVISNQACLFLSQLNPWDPDISIEQHLISAVETLHEMDFIGLVEEMEVSLQHLCEDLKWEMPQKIPVHNTTSVPPEGYSTELILQIAERNWADMELYQTAKELFNIQKANHRASPIEEVRLNNQRNVTYLFNEALEGFGWCLREKYQKTTFFRWLDCFEHASINLPFFSKKGSTLQIELCILPELLNQLLITVNDQSLPYSTVPLEPWSDYQWYTCTVEIPCVILDPKKKFHLEIHIEDPLRTPGRDFYRGRCGVRKISIKSNKKDFCKN